MLFQLYWTHSPTSSAQKEHLRPEPKDRRRPKRLLGQTEGAEPLKELHPPVKRWPAETYSQVTRSAGRM